MQRTIRFHIPAYGAKYAGSPTDTADLVQRDGRWWLHVVVTVQRKTETQRRIHSWSFAQLKSFIEYKAEERGCTVVAVDPRHTSQACGRCGHTARNNRRSRALFVCRSCGFSLHADLNGARNIAAKYRAGGGMTLASGLSVNQPLVSNPIRSGRVPSGCRKLSRLPDSC